MDLLHFMKEEYSAIRAQFPAVAPGDLSEGFSTEELHAFMSRLELVIRVGGELVIPELVDAGRAASAAAMFAEEQTKVLARVVATYKKSGAIPDAKRADVYRKVAAHVDQMEKVVLPLLRELIPTAVREDIGEIAVDYRQDILVGGERPAMTRVGTTISA